MILLLHRAFTFILLGIAFFLGMAFFIVNNKVVDLSVLENYNPGKPTILLDDEGKEWARFQLDRREPISIGRMPKHLINAFLAAEDHNFFSHSGISWKGILRSTLANLYYRRIVQGASTITQQLVKLLFFDAQKTFTRKVKEQFYSLIVERQFTKEQILETYLNHVYFGSGIYGVQSATQRFWGVPVEKISVDQAATLAAIVRSPASYSPLLAPSSSQQRRNVILHSMFRLRHITEKQYEEAKKIPLTITAQRSDECAPHLKETLRQSLEEMVGRQQLYSGGLVVQTTINKAMQLQAQSSFIDQFGKMRKNLQEAVDGGLLSIDVQTGAVKAMVGGVDFETSKFNRAWQAHRQMGSIFKPIIFAAAVEQGSSFVDLEIDEPFELVVNNQVWAPQNSTQRFDGPMTLARALSSSNNIISVKTLLKVGCQRVKELGEKCHIPGLQPYPSLALGCVDITLKEAAGFFNVFANNGVYVEPHLISWIKDEWGNKIFKYQQKSEYVMASRVSSQVVKVLGIGMERMRLRTKNAWVDGESIGKTGTTNDSRTCWFCGSTPTITTAVYVGCDDNRSLGESIYARGTAFPIWFGLHKTITSSKKKFSYDSSLREVMVNAWTGKQVDNASAYDEVATLLI
jgi:penicillin-binding protein 1A